MATALGTLIKNITSAANNTAQAKSLTSGNTAASTGSTGSSGGSGISGAGSTITNILSNVANAVTQDPSLGSLVNPYNIGQYNAINTNYQNQLNTLNNGYDQYITTLNSGANGANAALESARSNAIDQIQRNYDDSARNYYRLYRKQENDLPEQLSSIGATGGASESAALNLLNKYSDNIYQNENSRNNDMSDVNSDYYNAVAQNSQQLAQQVANAYLQLAQSQAQLEGQKNEAQSNFMSNLYNQYLTNKQSEADAAAQAQADAAQRSIDEWNAAVSKNIALRTSQGYKPQTWYDADGKLHYTIAGQSLSTNSGGSSGSSASKASSSSSNKTSTSSSTKSTGSTGSSGSSGLTDKGLALYYNYLTNNGITMPNGQFLPTSGATGINSPSVGVAGILKTLISNNK